jgi:tetratricopeptide (TPR) repeat protein
MELIKLGLQKWTKNPYREVLMSVKFGLASMIAGGALLVAVPSFAMSPPAQTFSGAESAGYKCATAAASAQAKGAATDGELASCTMAINLAGDDKDRLAAALTNRGVMHLARAEYGATIADSSAALQVDGKVAEALVNRGVALMLSSRPGDAVKDITAGLALAPSHAERAYFNRAMAREDMGDLRGAYLDYRQAAKMDPSWDRPKKELARFTVVQHTPTS